MNASILRRAGLVMMIAVGLSAQGRAQSSAPTKLQGTIHDNASALGSIWVISGEWSLEMKGNSGKADFFASLTMKQDGQVPGAPHTHHISLKEGTVTELAKLGVRHRGNRRQRQPCEHVHGIAGDVRRYRRCDC